MIFCAVTEYCISNLSIASEKKNFHLDRDENKNLIYLFSVLAPSPITVVKREKSAKNSIALSWKEPDRPNGIILEYEIKYFQKVITGGR